MPTYADERVRAHQYRPIPAKGLAAVATHCNIRQNTSAYVSIRQNTSACVSICVSIRLRPRILSLRSPPPPPPPLGRLLLLIIIHQPPLLLRPLRAAAAAAAAAAADAGTESHEGNGRTCLHTSAYSQHTSACVSIRQHTSATVRVMKAMEEDTSETADVWLYEGYTLTNADVC